MSSLSRLVCCTAVFLAAGSLSACGDDNDDTAAVTTTSSSGAGAQGGGGGAGPGGGGSGGACDATLEPPAPPTSFCERVTPGEVGKGPVAIDLSAAHAMVRFFGPVAEYADADQALAAALDPSDAFEALDLAPYAQALPGIACALAPVDAAALGAATVEDAAGVAIVHPGTGDVKLPDGATGVLVDLRGLPNVEGLREALEAAVAPALEDPVARPRRLVRKHDGLTDEVFSATNVYTNAPESLDEPPIPASGEVDLPVGLLTEAKMPAEAVAFAAALRMAAKAFIFGEDLSIEVAETRWQGIGTTGVASRFCDLGIGSVRLPDALPADRRMANPECIAPELAKMGAPPAPSLGDATRAKIAKVDSFQKFQPVGASLGEARAALVVAHGAARGFFAYFGTVGDVIDDRLAETLDGLGAAPGRKDILDALHRFGEALSDGHCFVNDYGTPTSGVLPASIEDIDGEPVVRRSAGVGVNPGDTIVSIDGVAAADWYATEFARTSAATDGYRFNLATRRWLVMHTPTMMLGLRDPDGVLRTIEFAAQPIASIGDAFVPSVRPSGPLTDLGGPDVYYINLAGEVLSNIADFKTALEAAQGSAGLVLDMRGYPGMDHYEVARRLIQQIFSSPIFRETTHHGPDTSETVDEKYDLTPLSNPSFNGSVALIVGHATVSAAENFSTMLVDANRVKVFGRRSAGTNGNITGVQLPGRFTFSFTGMEVRHADAAMSVFHGIGIVPDDETPLTPAAFRDGEDPELLEAMVWLQTT